MKRLYVFADFDWMKEPQYTAPGKDIFGCFSDVLMSIRVC